jgi:multidrug efflux system outer membrane protein
MSPRVPLLGVPLALLLGACAVGPDYVRPALPSAAAYPEVVGGVAEVGAAWWEGFAEPELDRLVVRALAANAELRLAVARVEEAAAQFDDTSAAGLPAVDATAGDSGYKVSTGSYVPVGGTAAGRSRRTLRGGLSTSFELDFWGKVSRAEEGARAQLLASEQAAAQVRLTLVATVVRGYAQLRTGDAQVIAAQNVLAAREEELAVMLRRQAAGSAQPAEVATAEVNRAAAVGALHEARRLRAQAEHLLGFLTGQPALVVEPLARSLKLPPLPASGLPSDLLSRRPDVQAAEQALVAANARIGFVKAARFPTFTLTGAVGTESKALAGLFESDTATSSLGVDLRFPLLDYGRAAARVEAAVAAQHQAAAAYEKAALNAFREVRDALADVRETAAAAEAAERRLQAAAEAFRVAEVRARAGQAGPLERTAALRAFAESELAVARIRQDRLAAQVDLIKALGGARPDAGSSAR